MMMMMMMNVSETVCREKTKETTVVFVFVCVFEVVVFGVIV